jgi:hypothetical protein
MRREGERGDGGAPAPRALHQRCAREREGATRDPPVKMPCGRSAILAGFQLRDSLAATPKGSAASSFTTRSPFSWSRTATRERDATTSSAGRAPTKEKRPVWSPLTTLSSRKLGDPTSAWSRTRHR